MSQTAVVNTKKGPKNSAIEGLRVCAMLFVVLSHACVHSGFKESDPILSFNSLFIQWGVLGNLGVDVFVLISGYFLSQKKNTYQSIVRLLLQVWFYSLLLFLVSWLAFDYHYSLKGYLRVFFPTIFQEYWFFTTYIVLVLLSPYINLCLESLDRRRFEKLLCLLLFLWCIIPTFSLQEMPGGNLAQFLLLYVIGAYFSRYPDHVLIKKARRWCLVIVSFVLLFASTLVLDYLGQTVPIFEDRGTAFYTGNSLLIIGCAVGLFANAVCCQPFYSKFVNTLGSCTFGVYLIHDNPAIRNIVWVRILRNADYFSSPFLAVRIILCVLLVFSVSTGVEYLRIRYLEGPLLRMATGSIEKIKRSVRIKDR